MKFPHEDQVRFKRVGHPPRWAALAPATVAAIVAGACAAHPHAVRPSPASGDEIVITQRDIEALDARTAWEVVKRRVPQLSYQEDNNGRPVRVWRHGRGSIVLNENPLLFLDGVRVTDIGVLDDIPASQVDTIRILTGLAATTSYGTNAASGVVLVRTKRGGGGGGGGGSAWDPERKRSPVGLLSRRGSACAATGCGQDTA